MSSRVIWMIHINANFVGFQKNSVSQTFSDSSTLEFYFAEHFEFFELVAAHKSTKKVKMPSKFQYFGVKY